MNDFELTVPNLYKDVNMRTIETIQRTRILKVNYPLKNDNANSKVASDKFKIEKIIWLYNEKIL